MKIVCALLFAVLSSVVHGETFLDFGGALTLPMGGGDMRRIGGAAVKAGTYFSELSAIEASVGIQENFTELGVGLVTHWAAWELYDRFFGYSAFDPFVTAGVKGWVGLERGEVGPALGIGAFYHFSESLSVRAEVDAVIGVESRIEVDHTIFAGLHYTF